MKNDLEGFDVRPVFINKILNYSAASPLTGTETLIAKNLPILLNIDEKYKQSRDKTLRILLNEASPFISYRDAIFFLLDCEEEEIIDEAFEAIEAAIEEQVKLDATTLMRVIKEHLDSNMPANFIVSLYGEETKTDETNNAENFDNFGYPSSKTPSNFNNSGLNIDAMRDFLR